MPCARGDLVPMSRVHLATFNNFKNLLASEHLPVLRVRPGPLWP